MRRCVKCEIKKDPKAFVGQREICRLCWYYLTKEEKDFYIARSKIASTYMFNKEAWEKEKLLLKPRLNFKIL